jgi:hypothetical protein
VPRNAITQILEGKTVKLTLVMVWQTRVCWVDVSRQKRKMVYDMLSCKNGAWKAQGTVLLRR